MFNIRLVDLPQSFSFLTAEKPDNVWAFSLAETQPNKLFGVHGIPHEVLETVSKESTSWTGWCFNNGKALLLFKEQEDAIIARLRLGEISNV